MNLISHAFDYDNALNLFEYIDDVIISNPKFSSYPYQFSIEEIAKLCDYANLNNKNIYIYIDNLFHSEELEQLKSYLLELNKINVKNIMYCDLGIVSINKEMSNCFNLININTTLNTNYESMNEMKPFNVNMSMLSNEISVKKIYHILENMNMKSMLQIHGKQRIFYSNRLLLKSYFTHINKNSNDNSINSRYVIKNNEDLSYIYEQNDSTYIYTYHDLCSIEYLDNLNEYGLDFGYINNLYYNQEEHLEIIKIYQNFLNKKISVEDALLSFKELNQKLSISFLNDDTVFNIEDVRRMEEK